MSLRDSHFVCETTDSRGFLSANGAWRVESQSRSDVSDGEGPVGNTPHERYHFSHTTRRSLRMSHEPLIAEYLAGPAALWQAIQGMTPAQLNAAPIPGMWSTRQVICHIADF